MTTEGRSQIPKNLISVSGCVVLFAVLFVVASLTACKPAYYAEVEDLSKRAKASINPTNLQSWATAYLSTNSSFKVIAEADVLLEVRKLLGNDPEAIVMETNAGGENSILISWGSGFGHRGFWVGSPGFRAVVGENPMYVVEWIPGVYFHGQTR